jgi:hypothetical protein
MGLGVFGLGHSDLKIVNLSCFSSYPAIALRCRLPAHSSRSYGQVWLWNCRHQGLLAIGGLLLVNGWQRLAQRLSDRSLEQQRP